MDKGGAMRRFVFVLSLIAIALSTMPSMAADENPCDKALSDAEARIFGASLSRSFEFASETTLGASQELTPPSQNIRKQIDAADAARLLPLNLLFTALNAASNTANAGENEATGTAQQAFSSGHETVGELELRGPMTTARKVLCQWIADST